MKKILFLIVCVIAYVNSANAGIPEANRFWLEDKAFIEWNGKTLKIMVMGESAHQLVIHNNSSYNYSGKDTQIHVYTPEKDAVNDNKFITDDTYPARSSICEKDKAIYTNIPVSKVFGADGTIEYLTYDIVMTTSQVELTFHILTFAKGGEQSNKQIYHQIFEVVEEGFVL